MDISDLDKYNWVLVKSLYGETDLNKNSQTGDK